MKKENLQLLAVFLGIIIIYLCVTVSQVIYISKALEVDLNDCRNVLESLQED